MYYPNGLKISYGICNRPVSFPLSPHLARGCRCVLGIKKARALSWPSDTVAPSGWSTIVLYSGGKVRQFPRSLQTFTYFFALKSEKFSFSRIFRLQNLPVSRKLPTFDTQAVTFSFSYYRCSFDNYIFTEEKPKPPSVVMTGGGVFSIKGGGPHGWPPSPSNKELIPKNIILYSLMTNYMSFPRSPPPRVSVPR